MRQIIKTLEPDHFRQWKEDYAQLNRKDATYDDLKYTREYGELKRSLLKEQGYICCYCEKRIGQKVNLTDCDIEHFMPRHPDKRKLSARECQVCTDAQLTYENLFASCKGEVADCDDHCNHKKDNWFDFKLCISPCDPKIGISFGYKLNGKVFAVNSAAQEMEKHLNLNSYILQEQRKSAFITVLEMEFDDEDLFEDKEYVEAVIEDYFEMKDGQYAEFCSMITYCLTKYYT